MTNIRTYCAFFVLTILGAAPALAQNDAWCQNIWLSRNTVMDRAGQCFGTPLGQAVFDNSNCVPGERPLNPLDAAIVAQLAALEADFNCAVDTSATQLHPDTQRWRTRLAQLWTVPIRADTEHGCGGYLGPALELHAGISSSTSVIGQLEPGQNFSFAHVPMPPNWEYITVSDEDFNFVAHGWVQGIEISDDVCEWSAG